jgi:hypothetical protein
MNQDDFLSLSNFLLGIPLTGYGIMALDPDLVQSYFNLLQNNSVDLSALLAAWHPIAGLPPGEQGAHFDSAIKDVRDLWAQAQMLIMLWYTGGWGQLPRNAEYYGRALVWVLAQRQQAVGMPKSFGYWQYSPEVQP